MTNSAGLLRRGLCMTACLAALFAATSVEAQKPAAKRAAVKEDRDHKHGPIVLESRPIVSRYDVSLTRPRRLLVVNGNLYVADFGGGTVVRIDKDGNSTVVTEDLNEPAGLAVDSLGRIYVSTFAQGMAKEGTIIRIGRDRMTTVFATGLTGPTALAFDTQDVLHVAGLVDNVISRVSEGGEVTTFVANIPAPSGLVFDARGDLYVLSASEGSVYRIRVSAMSEVSRIATGLASPSDLIVHPSGQMVAVEFGRRQLVTVSSKGATKTFALVPRGTVAAEFDRLGNMIIANSDDRSLVKVTSNLSIKCPHCGRRIPVYLRPKAKPRPPSAGSDEKPMPPAI